MDIVPIYKRVIGLDVHQAQITGCAIVEHPDGSVTYERREFGGFKRDRKALAEWAHAIGPDVVVMESTGILEEPVCGTGIGWYRCLGSQRPPRQGSAGSQDR